MTKFTHPISCLLLTIALIVETSAFAQDKSVPTGRGKIGGGIALTIAGSVVGGLMIAAWGMGACGESTNYGRCSGNLVGGGAVVAGLGLGIGIPLIVSGARQRKAYKKAQLGSSEFESTNNYATRETLPGFSLGINLVDRRPALGIDFGF